MEIARSVAKVRLSEIAKQKSEELLVLLTLFEGDVPATAKLNLKFVRENLNDCLNILKRILEED